MTIAAPARGTAQDWESADAIPGGGHGDTIIQLPDGSILNAFHIKVDGDIHRDTEWVTRWKANEPGSSWVTIDHLAISGDLLESRPFGAASYYNPANGTIEVFVVGYAYVNDLITRGRGKHKTTEYYEVRRWVVRRGVYSPGTGTWLWETVRMLGNDLGIDQAFYAKSVAIDANGTVYVTGRSNNIDWLTEVSTNGGDSWTESDRWRHELATTQIANGITIGLDGAVFASGSATEWYETQIGKGKNATIERTFLQHWITRKLDPDTRSWSVVDDYVSGNVGNPSTTFLTSNGVLLVGGQSNLEVGGERYWTLRASGDNGATWIQIDNFSLAPGGESNSAISIAEGSGGTIYVGGRIKDAAGYTVGIRFTQNLVNWGTELLPAAWQDLDSAVSVFAAAPNSDGGPFLYCSEAGPDPDSVLIRKQIP